jgi:hypothetical protein
MCVDPLYARNCFGFQLMQLRNRVDMFRLSVEIFSKVSQKDIDYSLLTGVKSDDA